MKIDILRSYLARLSVFLNSKVVARRQLASSAASAASGKSGALLSRSSNILISGSYPPEADLQHLLSNDYQVLNSLNSLVPAQGRRSELTSSELARIAQVIISRLDDAMVNKFSKMNEEYKCRVFSVYKLILNHVVSDLYGRFRSEISNEMSVASRVRQKAIVGMIPKKPRPLLPWKARQSSKTVTGNFLRTRSMFDLNAEPSVNSRQYSSGLDYPYLNQLLKSVDYDDRLIRNQRAAVVTIDNSLSEKAIELSLEDPRRAMYTRLKRAMMSPDVRAALYLMTNTSKFSRQSRGHDTLRLSHLEHFIELLDSENNFRSRRRSRLRQNRFGGHRPEWNIP